MVINFHGIALSLLIGAAASSHHVALGTYLRAVHGSQLANLQTILLPLPILFLSVILRRNKPQLTLPICLTSLLLLPITTAAALPLTSFLLLHISLSLTITTPIHLIPMFFPFLIPIHLPRSLLAPLITLRLFPSSPSLSARKRRRHRRNTPPLLLPLLLLLLSHALTHPLSRLLRTLHPRPLPPNHTLLAQARGPTGLISVIEIRNSHRMLTADLSVLGGYHIRKGYHPDSIFSQFHLHEAVRLAGTSNTSGGKNGHTLCIGVGVGVVPASLRRLGCIVDAIEIDPIVARFATTYFALQTPVIVQDARHFVNIASDHTYDYVIHDVFTGGDASYALFTESFFRDVRRIMRPNGVLALNFVAEMKGNENNMGAAIVALIYDRLQTVFGFVRLFSDGVDGHIHNFVLFASATKEGVMFRTPVERDSLGSDMRLSVLREFEKDEVFRRDLGSSKGVAVWQRGVWRIAAVHRRLMSEIHSKQLWPALLAAEHIA